MPTNPELRRLLARLPKAKKFRPPKVKWGAVVLLDALGTRDRDIDGARDYIRACHEIVNSLYSDGSWFRGDNKQKGNPKWIDHYEVMAFGDTLLISAGYSDKQESEEKTSWALLGATWVATRALTLGFDRGIPFRGAIATGRYICSESMLLGPCVTDAAAWYDKADWAGVTMTPKTGLREAPFDPFYIKYPVPLSRSVGGGRISLYSLAWPAYWFGGSSDENPNSNYPLKRCREALAGNPIPFGVESKAFNTLKFVRYLERRNANSAR